MLVKVATDKKKENIHSRTASAGKSTAPFNGSIMDHGTEKATRSARAEKKRSGSNLPAFTPWKVILASILMGACGILYIAHVFHTQQTLEEVNQLELEYNRALRHYNDHRLIYDRQTGPREIYRHARESGFINAGPADQILILEAE